MRHLAVFTLLALAGCPDVPDMSEDPKFPLEPHSLFPLTEGQVAAGRQTGEALEQPIQFPHNVHVVDLAMDCQYCHVEARKSIHSGVPPTQSCWNCHKNVQNVKESPEIAKLRDYCFAPDDKPEGVLGDKYATWAEVPFARLPRDCDNDAPIPWQKVHDLPDYVHFSHKRHIRGGLDCTECHGQVALMGARETVHTQNAAGEWEETVEIGPVMTRETSLQMGWCLNCHASHPSIDENYGELAERRRAELKDCWTCHK